MVHMGFCDILGFLFVSYCVPEKPVDKKPPERFHLEFQWSYLNFTWPSVMEYHNAITSLRYIPENNAMAGIKYYNNRMYVALPRFRKGTPITLAFVPLKAKSKTNPLLRPYPNWSMNAQKNCSTLQNVNGMEIDRHGVMWVIDGVRTNGLTKCPPKIVLLDLKAGGKVVQSYNFPSDVSLHHGSLLSDIVIDENDGGFAYITDNSLQDPGIIVYSRHANKGWKVRDATMFAEMDAAEFTVDGLLNDDLMPVDGIALSPSPKRRNADRLVYYSALSSFSIYAISSGILKDEKLVKSGNWRRDIELVGRKQSQSDGLTMDSKGNLYYGMLSSYAIGKWNTNKPFESARKMDSNRRTMIWPDSFAFDLNGFMYVLTNGINKFFKQHYELRLSPEIKFRILKINVGTNSYLYS